MIEHHEKLSQSRQCHLLGVARSSYYYQPQPTDGSELILLRQMDEQYLKTPQYGSRSYATWFRRQRRMIGRKKATSMMKILGIISTAPKPKTSIPAKQHKKYPYLLKGRTISRPNQVWATDITYVPMEKGFGYLVAIMDWHSRKVLSWRISNTLDADFCVQALEAAIQDHGCPKIMNSDQGVQFTSEAFTSMLKTNGIQISMDGKGCYYDNIFVERLWRTVKYEHLYTREFNNLKEVRKSLNIWFNWYNQERFHQSLDDLTPDEVYYQKYAIPQAA
ncbi:putative transposase [Nitrosomonas cryotolerans ATCC 49181]|uniref:Putative transposase n=3 Tax=Nitrosomonas cryotolerans TaxID=44575 RepID=A0A1N6G9M8_9PROT|nr:putative transposase [Nitrosomonas cryotolerans ATCC 49181]